LNTFQLSVFLTVWLMMILGSLAEMKVALDDEDIPRFSFWTGIAAMSACLPMML
jgi:hypothetical protein